MRGTYHESLTRLPLEIEWSHEIGGCDRPARANRPGVGLGWPARCPGQRRGHARPCARRAQPATAKPIAFAPIVTEPASPPIARPESDRLITPPPTSPTPPAKPESDRWPAPTQAKLAPPERPNPPDTKRKVETALTAAAIVAILIKASREQYYARAILAPARTIL